MHTLFFFFVRIFSSEFISAPTLHFILFKSQIFRRIAPPPPPILFCKLSIFWSFSWPYLLPPSILSFAFSLPTRFCTWPTHSSFVGVNSPCGFDSTIVVYEAVLPSPMYVLYRKLCFCIIRLNMVTEFTFLHST